jgi:hypothetical protein
MVKHPKRPRDPNQLGKLIVDISVGEREELVREFSDAQNFARQGGLKGGMVRAEKLTAEQRREIAKKAADARWAKRRQ